MKELGPYQVMPRAQSSGNTCRGTRANQWAILIAQESGDADGDSKAPTGDAYSSDDVEHTSQIAMAMTSLTG